jgi:RNA processing factor Prp31
MNVQESIRRILREETNMMRMILRRVPIEVLDNEFYESLEMLEDMATRRQKFCQRDNYIYTVITILMDGIHHELYSTTPKDSEWYEDVFNSLKNHYMDKILERHNLFCLQ